MRILSAPAIFVLTLGLAGGPASAGDGNFFLLSGKSLTCLRDHAAVYASPAGEAVFIRVEDCGSARAAPLDLMDQVMNSAPDIDMSAGDGPDAVVAFGPEDFACLSTLQLADTEGLLAYYPESCNVEPRD